MRLIWVLCVSLLLSCGSDTSEKSKSQSFSTTVNMGPFKMLKADQYTGVMEQFKGQKAVVLNLWATWCQPCVKEFPYLVSLRNQYQDDVEVVFISFDFPEAKTDAEAFLKKQGVTWDTYMRTGNDQEFFKVLPESFSGALPYTAFIAKDGTLVKEITGAHTKEQFEVYFRQLAERVTP